MSDSDDLELEALQRQLDDAFETTRPRLAFEDELWLRVQAQRPAPARLRDAWWGLIDGFRQAPVVPLAAVATLLVVVLGVGFLAGSGLGRGGSGTSSLSAGGPNAAAPQVGRAASPGAFGRLPSPVSIPGSVPSVGVPGATYPTLAGGPAEFTGPVSLAWTGTPGPALSSAPVFRYREPSTSIADQFAAALGASLQSRPAGYLGSYETTTFNIRVRGTVQSPPREPTFVMLPITAVAPSDAAGGPAAVGLVFLAEHSLAPSWPYTVDAKVAGDQAAVRYLRQFTVPGYGYAYLVDRNGTRYGMEVDLTAGLPTLATGPIALAMDQADYPLISEDQAVHAALASSAPTASPAAPAVKLTTGELVYVLVVAGDHSFYEPEFLFSGTLVVSGTTYAKHVMVPAVDPSQRR